MVGRRNAGWTASNSGHPCLCQNCPQGLPAEKTEEAFCSIIPLVPLTTLSVTGLNWTELKCFALVLPPRLIGRSKSRIRRCVTERDEILSVQKFFLQPGAPGCAAAIPFVDSKENKSAASYSKVLHGGICSCRINAIGSRSEIFICLTFSLPSAGCSDAWLI